MRYVGFDPGGIKAFGWAVLEDGASGLDLVASGTCSSALNALNEAQEACGEVPAGFATDAPLFWVDAGDRKADAIVRTLVCSLKGQSGTVSHVNSLRGACLVQGVQVTRLACNRWPPAKVTEAHPKALLRVEEGARSFLKRINISASKDHEKDAALAAYAAAAFVNQTDGWHDLSLQEADPFFPGGTKVAYWFPIDGVSDVMTTPENSNGET
jgi:predicted nuclease with RNAse H fold